MTKNKRKYNITWQQNLNSWCVEVWDNYDNYVKVYEKTYPEAYEFMCEWWAGEEKRKHEHEIRGKAILEMQKLDKESGILKGNYDGLD